MHVLKSVAYATVLFMRPYSELLSPPANAPHPFAAIANDVRKSYCSAYRWNQRNSPISSDRLGFPNVLGPLMDMVCDLPGDPPSIPPAPYDSGNQGKCKCGAYSATMRFTDVNGDTSISTGYNHFGPIRFFRAGTTAFNYQQGDYVLENYGDYPGLCYNTPFYYIVLRGAVGKAKAEMINVDEIANAPSGQCPPAAFPEYQDPVAPPPQLPDIQIPRLPGLPPLTIPIFLTPVLVRPQFTFSPEINVDVGGVNFNFKFDGWEISINPQVDFDVVLPPNQTPRPSPLPPAPPIYLPYPVNPPPSGGGGVDCCDEVLAAIAGVRTRVNDVDADLAIVDETVDAILLNQNAKIKPSLKDIQDCVCFPEPETYQVYVDVQAFTSGNSPRPLTSATVSISPGGDIRKTWEVDGGVAVELCGWYSFGFNGKWSDRKGLQYKENHLFPEDRNANCFTFSLYNGMLANGQVNRERST